MVNRGEEKVREHMNVVPRSATRHNIHMYPYYLRTQLTVFVGGVFLRSRKIFQRCFLETIFSPEGDTLKSYRSRGICSIALKF